MQSIWAGAQEAATPHNRGNITGRPWCWQGLEPGARDNPPRGTHTTRGNCPRTSSVFIESKSRSSSETWAFFINLTPWAFQKCLEVFTDKHNACGRRGLWSCCGDCISPLPPAHGGGLFLLVSPSQRVDLALQFLGNKPSPPLKLVGFFFQF